MNIKKLNSGEWVIECDPKFVASAIIAINNLQSAALFISDQMVQDENMDKIFVGEMQSLSSKEAFRIMEYVLPFMNELENCLTNYDHE